MHECILNFYTANPSLFFLLLSIAAVIELILKGLALWCSARRRQKVWFVCLLIFNTVGILPIIYLIINRKKKG